MELCHDTDMNESKRRLTWPLASIPPPTQAEHQQAVSMQQAQSQPVWPVPLRPVHRSCVPQPLRPSGPLTTELVASTSRKSAFRPAPTSSSSSSSSAHEAESGNATAFTVVARPGPSAGVTLAALSVKPPHHRHISRHTMPNLSSLALHHRQPALHCNQVVYKSAWKARHEFKASPLLNLPNEALQAQVPAVSQANGVKPRSCPVCSRSFSRHSNLIRHMRVHTGERPFQCHVCFGQFSVRGNLSRHMRVHSGERPFQCKDCGKGFGSRSNLSRHELQLHSSASDSSATDTMQINVLDSIMVDGDSPTVKSPMSSASTLSDDAMLTSAAAA